MRTSKNIFLTILASFLTVFLFAGCSGCSQGIKVTGIDFGEPIVELRVGDMYELNAVVAPADADNSTVLLTSDGALSTNGEEVVLFQRNKKILANAPGEAVITARTQDGSFTDTLRIRVFDKDVKLSVPANLRLDNGKVVWDKVTYTTGGTTFEADAYVVTLNGVAHEVGGNMLEFAGYDLNTNNVVTVQAISNTDEAYRVVENSEVSSELHFNKLLAPTNLTREGNILSWSPVEGAAGYQLVVNGEKQDKLITSNSTVIDFDAEGSYSVSVIAIPAQNEQNTMYQSDESEPVSLVKLGKVQNVKMENYVLSYDELANSSGYIINIVNNEKSYVIDNTTFTSINLAEYVDEGGQPIAAGEYAVTVVAKNNATQGVDGLPSDELTLVKLKGVNNTQITANAFSWSRVTGAISYNVKVTYTFNEEEFTLAQSIPAANAARFSLPEDAPETTYHFSVMAVAAGTSENGTAYMSSEWVESNLDPEKLPAPTNVRYDDTTFIFDKVEGAMGYDVIIDNEPRALAIKKTEEGKVYASCVLPSKVTEVNEIINGAYDIYIRANGGANNFCSNPTSAISVNVLPMPQIVTIDKQNKLTIKMTNQTMTQDVAALWEANNIESFGYEVVVEQIRQGEVHSKTYNYPADEVKFDDMLAGNVQVKVRKIGDGVTFISSDYALLHTKRESELVNVKADGNKITWSAVLNATYAIEYDGVYTVLTKNEFVIPDTVTAEDTVTVKLYNLGAENAITSKGKEYTFTRLPSPVVSLTGNTVNWTAVEGAAKYRIQLLYNNQVVTEAMTDNADVLNYSGYNFGSLGAHQVRVSAIPLIAEGNYVFSSLDGVLTTNKLGFTAEDTFTVANEVLSWSFNDCGATEEEIDFTLVFANSSDNSKVYTFTEVNGHNFNLYEKQLAVGVYFFTIKADYVGEHRNDFVDSSVYSPTISVQVLGAPQNVKKQGDEIVWDSVLGATSYLVTATYGEGEEAVVIEEKVLTPNVNLTSAVFNSGDFKISVQTIANNDNIINERYKISSQVVSLEQTFTKLDPVVVSSYGVVDENYVVTIEEVTTEGIDAHVLVTRISGENKFVGQDEVIVDGTVTRALTDMQLAGTYEYKISAKDSTSTKISSTPAIINVVRFGYLNNLHIESGNLKWDNVEGATYEIIITSGENTITKTSNTNSFDINSVVNNKENPLASGNYAIKARAIGNDILYLSSIDFTVLATQFNVLPVSTKIDLDKENERLVWDAVTGAFGYTVVFNSVDEEGKIYKLTGIPAGTLFATIPDEVDSGNWNVTVIAVGNGENIVDSSESQPKAIYKIPAPNTITHTGTTIFVEQVSTFTAYQIMIESSDGVEYVDFTFDANGYSGYAFEKEGTYSVSVKVLGDYESFTDSNFSIPLIINKTAKVTGLKIENEKVKYDKNDFVTEDNETFYSVKFVNPADATDVVERLTKAVEVGFDGIDSGAYDIIVSIVTEDIGLLPSEENKLVGVYKLETPELIPQLNGLEFTWDMPANYGGAGTYTVKSFEIDINGKVIDNELNKVFTLGSEYKQGDYVFKVRAIGDGNKLISSDFTTDFEIAKLGSTTVKITREDPDVEISDYIISWDAVANAFSYKIQITTPAATISKDVGDITKINIDDLTNTDLPEVFNALSQYGAMSVAIVPVGNGVTYANGEISNSVEFVKFDVQVAQIKVESGKLVWTDVSSNISAYVLKVVNIETNEAKEFSVHRVFEFALDNSFPAGMYDISLKGYTNDTSEQNIRINTNYTTAIQAYKLQTPTQPVLKNGKFTFSTVTFSTEMATYPYQMEYGGHVTDFEVTGKDAVYVDLADALDYNALQVNNNVFYSNSSNKGLIRLRAIGNDSVHLTSDWSSVGVQPEALVYGQQLEAVEDITSSDGFISWTPVRNAKGYHIYAQSSTMMGGGEEGGGEAKYVYKFATTDSTTTQFDINVLFSGALPGMYNVSVIAVGDTYYTDSTLSIKRLDISILGECAVQTDNGVLIWQDAMGLAMRYTVKIYSYESKETTYKVTSSPYYTMSEEPAGRYRISVRAEGDNKFVMNGKFGKEVDVYKISTLTARSDTSTFLKDGDISAILPTKFADSNATGKTAVAFLDSSEGFSNGIKAVFTSPDNPTEFTEVVLDPSFDGAYVFRNVDPVDLTPGLYNVRFCVLGNSTASLPEDDVNINRLFVTSGFTTTCEMIVLDAPIVSKVEDGILRWNPVSAIVTEYPEMNYVVAINDETYNDVIQTEIDFNVDAEEDIKNRFNIGVAGKYSILVAARGNSTRYLSSVYAPKTELSVLRYPSQGRETKPITLSDGTLTWEYLEGAEYYEIYLYGNDQVLDGDTFIISNIVPTPEQIVDGKIHYELPKMAVNERGQERELYSGDYLVQIRAIGNGVTNLTSEFSPEQEFTRIKKVENLENEVGILTWKVNTSAYYYQLHIVGKDETNVCDMIYNVYTNPDSNETDGSINASIDTERQLVMFELGYDSLFYPGTYDISIRAIGNDLSLISSSYTEPVTFIKLGAPDFINIAGGKITWSEVPFAQSGYYLYVNYDRIDSVISPTFAELPEDYIGNPTNTYIVYVQAVGNSFADSTTRRYLNGSRSDIIDYAKKLINVRNYKITNGMLTWDRLDEASGYEIKFPETPGETDVSKFVTKTVNQGVLSYNLEGYDSGIYSQVMVRALGGSDWLNGNFTTLKNVTKVASPSVGFDYESEKIIINKQNYKTIDEDGNEYNHTVKKYEFLVENVDSGSKETVIYDISADVELDTTRFELDFVFGDYGSGKLNIYVRAIPEADGDGVMRAITSNYIADPIVIEIPASPSNLRFDRENFVFTWNAVEGADITYTVYYAKVYKNQITDDVIADDNSWAMESGIETNYFYPSALGVYTIIVRADSSGQIFSPYVGSDNGMDLVISETDKTQLRKAVGDFGVQGVHNLFASGLGTSENPYIIANPTQLSNMRYYPYSYYKLGGNINLSGVTMQPIGSESAPFSGNFNGAGYTISNYTYVNTTDKDTGLFGYITDATIQNVTMTGVNLTAYPSYQGSAYIGALVGRAEDSSVFGCTVTGAVDFDSRSPSASMIYYAGGLIGYAENTTVNDCINNVNVANAFTETIKASSYAYTVNAGGIAAYLEGQVFRCINKGTIKGTNYIGGILGQSVYAYTTVASIYQCKNAGAIEAVSIGTSTTPKYTYVGGIVGRNYMYSSNTYTQLLVEYCYNTGSITLVGNAYSNIYAGGFAGYSNSKLKAFYTTGKILSSQAVGSKAIGGIVGRTDSINQTYVDENGNSLSNVIIYHAYYATTIGANVAAGSNATSNMITGTDLDWDEEPVAPASNSTRIKNNLIGLDDTEFKAAGGSEVYPVLKFEAELENK